MTGSPAGLQVHAPDKDGTRDPGSSHYIEAYLYGPESDPYELDTPASLDSHPEFSDALARARPR